MIPTLLGAQRLILLVRLLCCVRRWGFRGRRRAVCGAWVPPDRVVSAVRQFIRSGGRHDWRLDSPLGRVGSWCPVIRVILRSADGIDFRWLQDGWPRESGDGGRGCRCGGGGVGGAVVRVASRARLKPRRWWIRCLLRARRRCLSSRRHSGRRPGRARVPATATDSLHRRRSRDAPIPPWIPPLGRRDGSRQLWFCSRSCWVLLVALLRRA